MLPCRRGTWKRPAVVDEMGPALQPACLSAPARVSKHEHALAVELAVLLHIGADIIPRGQKLTVELCHSRAPPPGAGCRSVRAHDSISGSGNGATGPAWATGPTREVTCSNCLRCATGPAGHTGPTGPTGPTGEVKVQNTRRRAPAGRGTALLEGSAKDTAIASRWTGSSTTERANCILARVQALALAPDGGRLGGSIKSAPRPLLWRRGRDPQEGDDGR